MADDNTDPRPHTASRHSEGVTRPLSRCGRRRFVTVPTDNPPQPTQPQQQQQPPPPPQQQQQQHQAPLQQQQEESQQKQQQKSPEQKNEGSQQHNNILTGAKHDESGRIANSSSETTYSLPVNKGGSKSVTPRDLSTTKISRTSRPSVSATTSRPSNVDTHGILLSRRHSAQRRRFSSTADVEHIPLESSLSQRDYEVGSGVATSGGGSRERQRQHPDSGYSSLWSRPESQYSLDLDIRSVNSPITGRLSEMDELQPPPEGRTVSKKLSSSSPESIHTPVSTGTRKIPGLTSQRKGKKEPLQKSLSDSSNVRSPGKLGKYQQPLPNIYQSRGQVDSSTSTEDTGSKNKQFLTQARNKTDVNKAGRGSKEKSKSVRKTSKSSSMQVERKKVKESGTGSGSSLASNKSGRGSGAHLGNGSRSSLGREPDMKEPHVTLAIRLPDGKRLQRRFSPRDRLSEILVYAKCHSDKDLSKGHQLASSSVPQTIYRDMQLRITETDIEDRTLVHVQAIPED